MNIKHKVLAFAVMALSFSTCNADKLSIDLDGLRYLSNWHSDHEAMPKNVPSWYDWGQRARMGRGSIVPRTPEGAAFKSFVGWGQIFSVKDVTVHPTPIAMRNYKVLVCHGQNHQWTQIQSGDIEGAQYVADFSNNTNKPPKALYKQGDSTVIDFDPGWAYHFWAKSGRSPIPTDGICGVIVLAEAKNFAPIGKSVYVIGFSGDYWLDQNAQWVSTYANNKDIGIGRLGMVTDTWKWFGMVNTSDLELSNLVTNGYSLN